MGAQPAVPAGRVRESLVIAATFGPLALFHLLSQSRDTSRQSAVIFDEGEISFFLKICFS